MNVDALKNAADQLILAETMTESRAVQESGRRSAVAAARLAVRLVNTELESDALQAAVWALDAALDGQRAEIGGAA